MHKSHTFVVVVGLSSLLALPALAAPPTQLQACKEEFARASCTPKTEADAHECIEKVEKEGQKDEGLTHACYEAHERYEHQHKQAEHHEHHEHSKAQR